MIKFGSRVDVLLPLYVDLKIKTGDITIAGETILGEFPRLDWRNNLNENYSDGCSKSFYGV